MRTSPQPIWPASHSTAKVGVAVVVVFVFDCCIVGFVLKRIEFAYSVHKHIAYGKAFQREAVERGSPFDKLRVNGWIPAKAGMSGWGRGGI